MMLSQYIQSPYIVFPFGLAKPALIIAIIYVFMNKKFQIAVSSNIKK